MQPWRAATRPREGLACLAGAALLAVACLALLWGAKDDHLRLAAAGLAGLGAWFLGRMGQRRRTPVIVDVDAFVAFAVANDLPLGLYLRPFRDDGRHDHGAAGRVHQGPDEEELAVALAGYCLPVAIGRPGEPLPARGAYRLYAGDASWRGVVGTLIDASSVIVLRWMATEHVAWELQRIVDGGGLGRTVFFLPPPGPRDRLADVLPAGLHEALDAERIEMPRDDRYAAFLTLDGDGAGRLHHRHTGEPLEDAAVRMLETGLALPALDRERFRKLRGLHSPLERTCLAIVRLCFVVPAVAIAGVGLLLLDAATVGLLTASLDLGDALDWLGGIVLGSLVLGMFCALVPSRGIGRL